MTTEGGNTYRFDFNNRLIMAVTSLGAVTLKYDPAGRLYQIAGAGLAATRFVYDGADRGPEQAQPM